MTTIPAGIAAELGQERLNFALSSVKKSAEADRAVADILQSTVPSGHHGKHVNIKA